MTKKAVVTITYGDFFQRLANLTHPTIKAYADKLGADFIVWSEAEGYTIPEYKKMEIGALFDVYDRVAYIDTDILIRGDAPDIFDVVPEDQMGMLEEGQYFDRRTGMLAFMTTLRVNISMWDGNYYNAGVIVCSKCHRHAFVRPPVEYDHFREQTWLNVLIADRKIKMFPLPYRFNRLVRLDPNYGESWLDCWFLHYAGVQFILTGDQILASIAHDLEAWRQAAPHYQFRHNVVIFAQGGLGSQVAAEPVIRYAREVLYPVDNLAVVADAPEIFSHLNLGAFRQLESLPHFRHYRRRYTHRDPDAADHLARHQVHPTTLASIVALGVELSSQQKTPRLRVSPTAVASLAERLKSADRERLVLLHPGRGAAPKTFPADVWQSYADVLVDNGYTVAVIGKRMGPDKGIVEFDRSRCIDLVDRLSVEELIALVSQARVLVSNDSGPVQIAGAFGNWIGLVATLRHPQCVLPWRNGSQYWRAASLERQAMYYDYSYRPSGGMRPRLDACAESRLRECLPEPPAILAFVNSAFAEA